ncbi:DUF4214 domain-containing protein [Halarcobacter sp.]|uniref:DUF4214 domain-containing protein n=1 Tax=Halarcobacter sp. TaxID=2321133 RepID=UPI002AA64154|nr:DUF4214 domain-containing protein [Halarcobacter sp.]
MDSLSSSIKAIIVIVLLSLMCITNANANTSQQEAFIERFYQNILGRTADSGGMSTWLDVIQNQSAAQVAMGFLNSQEFINLNLTNEEFLDVMYQTMFNRVADDGGKNDWLNKMNNGRTKQSVMFGFFQSQEFKNLTDSFGVTQILDSDRPSLSGVEAYVDRFYSLVLKRNYDESGFNDWVEQLTNQIKDPTEIASGFLFSSEYINQNEDNNTFLETCYQAFFGRASDAGGKADWLDKINNQGYTRQQVFEGFIGSQEFVNLVKSFNLNDSEENFNKVVIQNNFIESTSDNNGISVKTNLEKRDSGNFIGSTIVNTDMDKKVNITFPINNQNLFSDNETEETLKSKIDIKVEQQADGRYVATIPKDLISSWIQSNSTIVIDGEKVDVEIIDDDPVIGWPAPSYEEPKGYYSSDFVRPFNVSNLREQLLDYLGGIRIPATYPFVDIKSKANAKKSLISNSDTWNELTDSLTLKYQILYYANYDQSHDSIRNINIETNVKELDLFYDDSNTNKQRNFSFNLKQEYGNGSVYYIIGSEHYIAVDVESNKIIGSSLNDLINKDFSVSIYENNCNEDTFGKLSGCNKTEVEENYFNRLGYFTRSASDFNNITTLFKQDFEFMPYIHVDDNGFTETYGGAYETIRSYFGQYKEIKYSAPILTLTSDLENKTFIDGVDSINIKWTAGSEWANDDVYISIQCKGNVEDKWYFIDKVAHIPNQENTYTWNIGNFGTNSVYWDDIIHDQCRIEIAKNIIHTSSDRSGYFNISSQFSLTYSWVEGDWSSCQGECGTNNGTQTRTVQCKASDGSLVNDSYCSGTKPSTSQSCTASECTDGKYTRENDIVTDNNTGLQWQDDIDAKTVTKTLAGALTYCENKILGGYIDWRLPTMQELQTIVVSDNFPTIDSIFENVSTNDYYYWSSTAYSAINYGWIVDFYSGDSYNAYAGASTSVRCVKDYNSSTPTTLQNITINGSSSLNENTTSNYTVTAYYSDGSFEVVIPSWSENSSYSSINSSGILSASSVSQDSTVTITASYNGKIATKQVLIKDIPYDYTGKWSGTSYVYLTQDPSVNCTWNLSITVYENDTVFISSMLASQNNAVGECSSSHSDGIITNTTDNSLEFDITYTSAGEIFGGNNYILSRDGTQVSETKDFTLFGYSAKREITVNKE